MLQIMNWPLSIEALFEALICEGQIPILAPKLSLGARILDKPLSHFSAILAGPFSIRLILYYTHSL